MNIRDEELLARLRALGSKARRGLGPAGTRLGPDDVVLLLGLPEEDLTPSVRAALVHLIEEVVELRQELTRSEQRLAELERLADEDALAPIFNRRAFLRHLERTISYIARYQAESSLLYFDLDGLKGINDAHGHTAGDAALMHVAQTLLAHTRSSDLVGRLGGDEFGIILARAGATVAGLKAMRLAEAVAARPVVVEEHSICVTVAYGAHGLIPGEEPQAALAAADRAMYAHKHAAG